MHSMSQENSSVSIGSPNEIIAVDPDQLFAKYTISEVRSKQVQLRADAEAKQEELRIMVGERYRELLQASTVIISIATSAERVRDALDEVRTTIHSQEHLPAQNNTLSTSKEDSHLLTLQVLSAHIKLLLDAPEQLWRLIEGEKYFQAAWLFLLASVVHRALVRDDAEDEDGWFHQGIDIHEQFPLIQRQWDTVSHFRTQIIHRATLSLRTLGRPHEESCAALLTLHILESRPLADTLTVYLSQRTKALNTLLLKSSDFLEKSTCNGQPSEVPTNPTKQAHAPLAAVKRSMLSILEAISQTLNGAREMFSGSAQAKSLINRILEHMQANLTPPSIPDHTLPAELIINSQAVLSALPSSTYFSLLPLSIRSYRPFVDLSSSSSSLCQELLEKLKFWFSQSISGLHDALHKALSSLHIVNGVWKVRLALRRWVSQCELVLDESSVIDSLVDEVTSKRIIDIWGAKLARAEMAFTEQLGNLGPEDVEEFLPLHGLYKVSSLPTSPPSMSTSSLESLFQGFRTRLAEQLQGRTTGLRKILGILEGAATSFQRDLSGISRKDNRLAIKLTEVHQTEVELFCSKVISVLSGTVGQLEGDLSSETQVKFLVFYGRLALELSTVSSFVPSIGCDHAVAGDFRQRMDALYKRIMNLWEDYVVSNEITRYTTSIIDRRYFLGTTSTIPSPLLIECLHSLSQSLRSLGMVHHSTSFSQIAIATLLKFSTAVVLARDNELVDHAQQFHDLAFLRLVLSTWQDSSVDTTLVDEAILRSRSYLHDSGKLLDGDSERRTSETLARTQHLLSALLPVRSTELTKDGDKTAVLLPYGVPEVDAAFIPAVELAQPSSRFPLLLIDA